MSPYGEPLSESEFNLSFVYSSCVRLLGLLSVLVSSRLERVAFVRTRLVTARKGGASLGSSWRMHFKLNVGNRFCSNTRFDLKKNFSTLYIKITVNLLSLSTPVFLFEGSWHEMGIPCHYYSFSSFPRLPEPSGGCGLLRTRRTPPSLSSTGDSRKVLEDCGDLDRGFTGTPMFLSLLVLRYSTLLEWLLDLLKRRNVDKKIDT